MAYRANFFLEIFGMMALFGAILFLWISVYANSAGGIVGGYTLSEMLTYIVGGAFLSSIVMSTTQGDEIDQEINEGLVSNYLLKPLNVSLYWFSRDISRKILTTFFGIISFIILFYAARNFLLPPASLVMFAASVIFVIMGMFLHFEIFYITAVASFWLGRTWGFRFAIRVIMEIATGAVIPLSLIPGLGGDILRFLPFKFLVYFPLQIYLGKFSASEIANEFLQFIAWIFFLGIAAWYLWRRGIKNYTASGA
jgi:ABC-2 type transport system permease protein